jgi:hypothetical protein
VTIKEENTELALHRHWECKKHAHFLTAGKSEETTERLKLTYEDNIKMGLNEIDCEAVN